MNSLMPGSYPSRNNNSNPNSRTPLFGNDTSYDYSTALENRFLSNGEATNDEIINKVDIAKILPQTANVMKSRNKLRSEGVVKVHNLIIMEILLVYLIDTSFFKMLLRVVFEITLMSFARDKVSQVLEFMSAQQNSTIIPADSFRETLKKMSKGLLFMLIFLNGILLMDHIFVFHKFSEEMPHYSTAETDMEERSGKERLEKILHLIYVFFLLVSKKIVKFWNCGTEESVLKYENPDNFNYNGLFINFIGELKPINRVGLISLDLSILFFQYLLYLQGLNQPDGDSDGDSDAPSQSSKRRDDNELPNDGNRGYEDGYQGTLRVLNLNLTPCLPYTELKDRVISFFVD